MSVKTYEIGSDETGKGVYIGPIIIVCSKVDISKINYYKSLGINDSKKLTDKKIIEIAKILKRKIKHAVVFITPKTINEYNSKKINYNKTLALGHDRCIKLIDKTYGVNNLDVIIDGFCSLDNYNKYISNNMYNTKLISKAEDRHISVGISSILARYYWICEMDRLSKELNYNISKKFDNQTIEKEIHDIFKNSNLDYNKYLKLNFKNVFEIVNRLNYSLFDF